ncbi:DUF72 domain-containing protein [Lutibacter sp. SG786]|uniref:DUF72 domain-containing protein n=1 Tax=Luteibacter sp. SG786 TaxID=2587130 RepID=UPI00141DAF10|nr:uncharacterized protein YecE (DUF72 family) [Luteibacter sp. SG786]
MKRAKPSVRIGCAGWSIPSRAADLFATEGSHLQRYAQVFPCVEINTSFYRPHQPKTYLRWSQSVPASFRFSVKMPRTITHELRLRECEAPLDTFLGEIASLGKTLGCILVQLPPSLALDEKEATAFFALLRKRTSLPVACEPRHATWFTPLGDAVLKGAGVACVQADPSPVADAVCEGDPGLLYIRLHGSPDMYYSAYDDAFLDRIAARIRGAQAKKRAVWCIFDNTARGEAIPNALALIERLA